MAMSPTFVRLALPFVPAAVALAGVTAVELSAVMASKPVSRRLIQKISRSRSSSSCAVDLDDVVEVARLAAFCGRANLLHGEPRYHTADPIWNHDREGGTTRA